MLRLLHEELRLNARYREKQNEEQQNEARQARNREHHRQRRQNEGEEEREARHAQDRERKQRMRAEEAQRRREPTYRLARLPGGLRAQPHTLGPRKVACFYCHALHFATEMNVAMQREKEPTFLTCCHRRVPELRLRCPAWCEELYKPGTPRSNEFLSHVRQYNNRLAFGCLSVKQDRSVLDGRGPWVFKISGAVYRRLGPADCGGNQPIFSQLYFLDTAELQALGPLQEPQLNEALLMSLLTHVREDNPIARDFQVMKEVTRQQNVAQVRLLFETTVAANARERGRYNPPRGTEIAALIFGGSEEIRYPHIAVYPQGGPNPDRPVQYIPFANPHVDALLYPLLFPVGHKGWEPGMHGLLPNGKRQNISLLEYYSSLISEREDTFTTLHQARDLFQQFVVDAYCKVEADRLHFFEHNQQQLRVETYAGLADFLAKRAEEEGARAGRIIVLPSTFTGGRRYMTQVFQDAMAIVRDKGRPTYFLTFTCNPNWPEIKAALKPGQQAIDRPDVVAVVFHEKLKALLKDLTDYHVVGCVTAWAYSVEFQKRLLPHAHILIIMENGEGIFTSLDVDEVVWAEIPNHDEHATLAELVEAHMMHGPCGICNPRAPCMEGVDENATTCNRNFPKEFTEETVFGEDAFPAYRRRNDGRQVEKAGEFLDNRHVVPYNPYLLLKYRSHINLEICASIKSVKYIYKYIYKGYDSAYVRVEREGEACLDHNEIKEYLDGRYVGSVEACWRLFKFELQNQSHTVYRLQLHLEDMQDVYFHEGHERQAFEAAQERETMLTSWFKLNQENECARQYLYMEIPFHFTWDKAARR